MGIEDDNVYRTSHHPFVTNWQMLAIEIWNQYKRGGDAGSGIKEQKEDFGVECFYMGGFAATEGAMRFGMVAYHPKSMFRQLIHQK